MSRVKITVLILILSATLWPALTPSEPASAMGGFAAPQAEGVRLEPALSGLSSPVYVTNAGDGSNRLFIVEQPGRIKVLQPGSSTPTVFLNIVDRVLSGGERGLLGLAFHPQFQSNRRFFLNYTRRPDGATVIAEYRVSATDANVADEQERFILGIEQPFSNHNGGMIEFGPDGFLYIGMGDGGSANDPGNRAQNREELLGKMLRINIDPVGGTAPYSSPADNPFFGPTAGRDEIYALGLRNPFRWSFDRLTGDLWAGDVGQGQREEIDLITKGGNYGWRLVEGSLCTNLGPGSCNSQDFLQPLAEYSHSGGRCSITGGYVYRGNAGTFQQGTYVFADFCTGEIFTLSGPNPVLLLDTSLSVSSFGEDEAGEIYVVDLGGTVQRLVNGSAPPPTQGLMVQGAGVRKRSSGASLNPVTIKPNGKKFEVVVTGEGFVQGSVIVVNGREMNTEFRNSDGGTPVLVARLRRGTLSETGPLAIEVLNPDGSRSNRVTLQVAAVTQ